MLTFGMIKEVDFYFFNSLMSQNKLKEFEIDKSVESFVKKYGSLLKGYDTFTYKLRERLYDVCGDLVLENKLKLTNVIPLSSGGSLDYALFDDYIKNSRSNLESALKSNKNIVFVMGHKNPDTDAVISSMFEAWRNHLENPLTVYVPIVQSKRLPDEVTELIPSLSDYVLLTNDPLYELAKQSSLIRWISVDQNEESEVQKSFVSIIDHHLPSKIAKNQNIPKTLELLGSCAALVTRKYLGMGFSLDEKLAKILYGASLMDTENKTISKMTKKDVLIMDYLKKTSRIKDDNEFYSKLMGRLLNTDDADNLFNRDYKDNFGFGFAVAKVKNCFSNNGEVKKQSLVNRLYSLANNNNKEKDFPLTLVKITDYCNDNMTVNRERIVVLFNVDVGDEFKKTIKMTLEGTIHFEFQEDELNSELSYVDLCGTGLQLSRKKMVPILQPFIGLSMGNDFHYV